jgi:hypothetical protein
VKGERSDIDMAANRKTIRARKPTVFLSHSSANRRELLGLQRLLNERAGGLIEFFLSSDEESIPHGSIWPAEVRGALDRMDLMLVFISSEALKSGWTYFEAGYGLHKLSSARIYCLSGTDKGSLPPPFNILQNRNLHSPKDVSLLIKQCNEEFHAAMQERVTQQEFDRIFKKPSMVQIESGPKFEELVQSVKVIAVGPPNSSELFGAACEKHGLFVSEGTGSYDRDYFISTGVKFSVAHLEIDEDFESEVPISEEDRKAGTMMVRKIRELLRPADDQRDWQNQQIQVEEVDAYNAKLRDKNEAQQKKNEALKIGTRQCEFELAPTNISIPIAVIDEWVRSSILASPIEILVYLQRSVERETRMEAITAKIHGSEISLRSDGLFQWKDNARINIKWTHQNEWYLGDFDLWIGAFTNATLLSEINLPDIVTALFNLNVIALPTQRNRRRR